MDDLSQRITEIARTDVATIPAEITIGEALARIRSEGLGERIVYFYVVDDESRLVGVIPVRRLLTAEADTPVSSMMIRDVVALYDDATLLDAHEGFAQHKLLALPIIDAGRRLVGVIDVAAVGRRDFPFSRRAEFDEVFEAIGFRLSQLRNASPRRAFRLRVPWLASTIAGGTVCAIFASVFEATLASSIVLAFFLTLVLGLAESVSMQSMTITVQALRATRPTVSWFRDALWREAATAILLGVTCGTVVGTIVWLWRGEGMAAVSIGGAIAATICTACIFGLSVPAILHALRLDPRVAAGPVTLAITDVCTIVLYLGLATLLL